MAALQPSFSVTAIQQSLSSSTSLLSPTRLFFHTDFSRLRLTTPTTTVNVPFKTTTICMGGGPRTFPGGVSKWQWKRMQAKKSKQLLKARLARERQIYEMRKRAELKAAISELERPWEAVEKAPNLFSVSADEQLKVLADRFQKPSGFDMWSEKDGPELFRSETEIPKDRFLPKGIVHNIKPYGESENTSDEFENSVNSDPDSWSGDNNRTSRRSTTRSHRNSQKATRTNPSNRERNDIGSGEQNLKGMPYDNKPNKGLKNNFRKPNMRRYSSTELDRPHHDRAGPNRGRGNPANKFRKTKLNHSKSAVFDMSLQSDGRYEFGHG